MDKYKYLGLLIKEAVSQTILEQEMMGAPPPSPPAPSMGAPAPTAPAGGGDVPPPQPGGAELPPGGDPEEQSRLQSQPGGITVDSIVERLNIIRAGKSLNEPEVYGKMRSLINGLTAEQKTILDFTLQEIEKVVGKVNPLGGTGVEPTAAPVPGQEPAAPQPGTEAPPPAPAPPQQPVV